MRTTVTLDEDVAQQIREQMRERGTGLKETLNELLRRGLRSHDPVDRHETPTFGMGARPGIDLDKALALADAIEDEETLRKVELRK